MTSLRVPLIIVLVVVAVQTFDAGAQTETNLHSFAGYTNDGAYPAALVQGTDSNFYGVTYYGGTYGFGVVFRITPSGSCSNLYSFGAQPNDGSNPGADGLVQGSDGNFYGTTRNGGTNYYGTVYRISPNGTETILHSFNSATDGAGPNGLVHGGDGNFYGTTWEGGAIQYGTVFQISPSEIFTNLYSFNDGLAPLAGLVRGTDGNFYGTTSQGGTNRMGTIFRISPSGTYTTLHSFVGLPIGSGPTGGLVLGSDSNFYGMTPFGGTSTNCYSGCGTIFRISPSGTYTSLYSFLGSPNDGSQPQAGLVQGSDGNFYGTTYYGGTTNYSSVCHCYGNGTVFRIGPSGSYTSLYSFVGYPNDGGNPFGPLVQGNDGTFYGTTYFGGAHDGGTVFRLTVPLSTPPYPINQITGFLSSGTNVVFNIISIAYETYQLQISTSLTPTNWVNVPGVSVTNSIGSLLTLTNFGGAVGSQGFYRFDITP